MFLISIFGWHVCSNEPTIITTPLMVQLSGITFQFRCNDNANPVVDPGIHVPYHAIVWSLCFTFAERHVGVRADAARAHGQPLNHALNEPLSQPLNQSLNQTPNRTLSQAPTPPVNQSLNQTRNQPRKPPISPPLNHQLNRPLTQLLNQ